MHRIITMKPSCTICSYKILVEESTYKPQALVFHGNTSKHLLSILHFSSQTVNSTGPWTALGKVISHDILTQ
jgi:hypothetical protein